MFISKQIRERNIAEYLLYMWQVEDLLRANRLDIASIRRSIIEPYTSLTDAQREELEGWYSDLIQMMRDECVEERGHLQVNKNVIIWLTELHERLLHSQKFPYYSAAYYKALPFIVELRAKGAHRDAPELETCFDALYGALMLRLQKRKISDETLKALNAISTLLGMLSDYYIKDKRGELEIE